jgi:uncharacterized RDD family membrane protein YckC
LGALVVDAFIIAAGLQFLGIPAYAVSGGRVQANVLLQPNMLFGICHLLRGVTPGFEIPSEFQPNYVVECVNSWFGFPTGRWIIIVQLPQPEGGTVISATSKVDAGGHPFGAFSLDLQWLLVPFLLAYRIGFEGRNGQTIGKRLTRVRVIEIDPRTSAVPPAAKRNLVLFLPILFASIPIGVPPWFALIVAGIFLGAIVAIVWQIAFRRDTYYDKAPGTAVIRVTAHSPPSTVRAPAA